MIANNIFSIFDPSSSYVSTNWIIIFLLPIIIKKRIKKKIAKVTYIAKTIAIFIGKEIDQITEKKIKFTNPIFIVVFFLLLTINTIAIFPFNFTPTAHISIRFSIRVTIWGSTILFGWKNHFNEIIAHLTPMGTPNALINFIVVIETISSLIRPITLSIRLSANIVAGHLLMSLLSSFSMNNNTYTLLSGVPIALLIILEIGVALVQSYVLMTLLLLYQNETA